ncbi:hypothetical protein HPULCUR_001115 [Helicostylum pulchrum]|uniref:Uncharacterized protein n=1 Tax=Helicostylum pulchrum TaxID=562976 RepID=A0ABP9XMU1_9FUNG
MNKYPSLPSISTLLTLPPSPPRIIVEDAHQQQEDEDNLSQRYLKSPNNSYNRLSPMLSPIDSYASSINSISSPNLSATTTPQSPLPSMLSLPPLQGDDPPRRLQRHSSISSSLSSPKQSFNSLWTSSAPPSPNPQQLNSPSLYPTSPSLYPQTSPSLYPQQDTFSPLSPIPKLQFQPTHTTLTPSPPPPPQQQQPPTSPMMLSSSRSTSPAEQPLLPSTQIVLNESGQPVLKRRRGRPPSTREPALEGGWTFLTPTVWDVNNPQQQRPAASTSSNTATSVADSVMNGSMAAFTSSNMDMVLQMPRKKRGRKPKTHIVGNSCFVWKDITASRRSTKVIKEQKAALRKLEQAPE